MTRPMFAVERPTPCLIRHLFALFGNIRYHSRHHDEISRPNLEIEFAKRVKAVEIARSGLTNDDTELHSRLLKGCPDRIIRLGLSIGVAIFANVGSGISVTDFH
jgi:hypothetical protein